MDSSFVIRKAVPADVPALVGLIRELALFEKAPEKVEITEEQLLADGFGAIPLYYAYVAEHEGVCIGYSVSYIRYSTWRGAMLYLEDFYVSPDFRGKGIGTQLLQVQFALARQMGIRNLCLQVLEWNQPAIDYYAKNGAEFDPEWWNAILPVPPAST